VIGSRRLRRWSEVSSAAAVQRAANANRIEQEGTYPLPEAQLDRFMVQLTVGYPSREADERIVVVHVRPC
jgi:MoxR-like ATPase